MAQNITTVNVRGKGRQRGDRRQMIRAAAAAVPSEYFAPERQWVAQRGPQIAKLASTVKMLTAMVNSEKQFYDVGGTVNPVVTPTAQYLNGIAEGDDTQGRQGRTIRAQELQIRMHFYADATATASQVVRVIVVKDNDPRGVVPTIGLLFQGGTVAVDGFPVLDNYQGRFKWLFDETFTLSVVTGGSDAKVVVVNQKLDHHINFTGSTGTTASSGQGALFLFVLTDRTTVATGVFSSRIRYRDN